MRYVLVVLVATLVTYAAASAGETVFHIYKVSPDGIGEEIGTVAAEDGPYGLVLTPALRGLPPGVHGFHVHQNPDCGAGEKDGKKIAGLAAGGHLDPADTGRHAGPYGQGHLGDLPVLIVGEDGSSTLPLLAPRLKAGDLKGRSLMIHAGGDNYSDQPEKLGGGGPRIACGVAR